MYKILIFVLGILALGGIMIWRSANYAITTDASTQVTLAAAINFDKGASIVRLSEALTYKTITIQTGDPVAGQEGPWLDFHAFLERAYPTFHALANKELIADYTLLYTWEGSNPSLPPLLFMAHQDVVPVNLGTMTDWAYPPFQGASDGEFVYGRGALDDKSSLIAQMEAVEALAKAGFVPSQTMIFLFGHDEEVLGRGAQTAIGVLKARGVAPEMALDEGSLTLTDFPLTGGPASPISVAEKGYMSLRVSALADGGHSSIPPRNSGTVRLSKLVVALDKHQMPAYLNDPTLQALLKSNADSLPYLQKFALANAWLLGGQVKKDMGEDPILNAMLRTTTAPTMLFGSAKENVLAQRASAIVNFRLHPSDTADDVINHVKALSAKIGGKWEIVLTDPGSSPKASPVSPTDTRGYRVISQLAGELADGGPVLPTLMLAATDSRYAYAITPNVYRYLPIRLSMKERAGIHGTNEKIRIDAYHEMVAGYTRLYKTLAGPKGS